MADHLGSIVQETNSTGQITLTREYDPFGNMIQGTGTAGYAFTGREWDPETGLYYYRARYYDPSLGRFLSEDPVISYDRQQYRYVGNNPIAWNDASGTTEQCFDVSASNVTKCDAKVIAAEDAGGKGCPFLISKGGGSICDALQNSKTPVPLKKGCPGCCTCQKTRDLNGSATETQTMTLFICQLKGGDWGLCESDILPPGGRRCKVTITATLTATFKGYVGECGAK